MRAMYLPGPYSSEAPLSLRDCQNIREDGKGRARVKSIMLRPRVPKLLPYESRGRKVLIFNYVPVSAYDDVPEPIFYISLTPHFNVIL
jgi:hypothetical protein